MVAEDGTVMTTGTIMTAALGEGPGTEPMPTTQVALTAAVTAFEEAEAALVALMESDDPARVAIAMAEDAVEAAQMVRDEAQDAHDAYVYALPENVAARMAATTAESIGIAMAIDSPTDAANGNGVPASATATRTTGGDTTVTLMNSNENTGQEDVAFDPAYASSTDATTPAITGWSGDTQVREGEGTTPSEYVTVYTNIKSAKPMKLTHDNTALERLIELPGNVIVLDDDGLMYTGSDTDDADDETVTGTVNGIPGTFTCAVGSCGVTFATAGGGVAENTVATLTSNSTWSFTSTENMESEADEVADYLYFGSWLQMADEDGDYAFQTFSGGDMPYTTNDMTNVKGEATYDGAAAGRYVMKELELVDGQVMPTSATHGQFTAAVALTAYFGGDDVSMTDQFSINGTVTNFKDGDTSLDIELKLDSTKFTASDTRQIRSDFGRLVAALNHGPPAFVGVLAGAGRRIWPLPCRRIAIPLAARVEHGFIWA